jgi:hypothetical protein
MNLEDAIDGLLTMADTLFQRRDPDIPRTPGENLQAVKNVLKDLLNRHGLPEDIRLTDSRLCPSKV